ncbi:hypothetical protein NFI96_028490, partial [Prochilodus magdalenae]
HDIINGFRGSGEIPVRMGQGRPSVLDACDVRPVRRCWPLPQQQARLHPRTSQQARLLLRRCSKPACLFSSWSCSSVSSPDSQMAGYATIYAKPWLNCEVRAALNARTAAFKSGHTEEYKKARYALRKTIRAAKRKPHRTPRKSPCYHRLSPPLCLRGDVCKAFKHVNIRNAPGPDGIPGRILKVCAHQLAGVFTDISNLSLSLSAVPACFKLATIVPVPKTARITTLNDWRPVALTSIISKCFEKLVRDFICSLLPATLDPLQFAYRQNRSTDDAIALTLHTALSHLDKQNMYLRMQFVDYSSALNTIVLSRLDIKHRDLGLNSSPCSWILNFLMDRRQAYREEVSFLTHWCQENNLSLKVNKTKELIVDFRKQERVHTPITINGAAVER